MKKPKINPDNIDIKDIGVPNICFSYADKLLLDKKNNKRLKILKKQRLERGFDDSELWSLDKTLANFLLPRLKRFNEIDPFIRDEKYEKDMKNFMSLLELESRENYREYTKKEQEICKKGLNAFPRLFYRLWF